MQAHEPQTIEKKGGLPMIRNRMIFTPQKKREIHAGTSGSNSRYAAEKRFQRETIQLRAAVNAQPQPDRKTGRQ
jgi:hypothetical protein